MDNILEFKREELKSENLIDQENLEIAQDLIRMMKNEDNLTETIDLIPCNHLGITKTGNVVYCDSNDVGYENALRKQKNKKYRHHLRLI